MLSMTGFGQHRLEIEQGVISVQMSAVNHRHCQVSLRSDLRDLSCDERVRSVCRKSLKRGSININVQWQGSQDEQIPNEQIEDVYKQLAALANKLNAPAPRIELLSPWLQRSQTNQDLDLSEQVEASVKEAIAALQAMRVVEGEQLQQAFTSMQQEFTAVCKQMSECEQGRVEAHRERLLERVREATADREITEQDLIKEVAVYADRIDISEEIVRLDSHLEQLGQVIQSKEEQVGKRLEFLLQECGREVNTIGSKAHHAALSQLVVDAKSILEQMREQAANVL